MATISPITTERTDDSQQNALSSLLQHPAIWQARHANAQSGGAAISSGYKVFDEQLHHGGWPCNGSTELFCEQAGIGEFSILLPALTSLLQQAPQRRLALIAPPYVPYAPALEHYGIDLSRLIIIQAHKPHDQLWANEQLLRCGHFAAVINWFKPSKSSSYASSSYAKLRRIQLAAQEGRCWSVSFRPHTDSSQSSPASLRIKLQANDQRLSLNIIKQQGTWAGQAIQLPRPDSLLTNTLNVNDWIEQDRANENPGNANHRNTKPIPRHFTLAGHSLPKPARRNIHPGFEHKLAHRRGAKATHSVP